MAKKYQLNGAEAKNAMLWFLWRERERHGRDIEAISRDITALLHDGAIMPEYPSLDTFVAVKGGNKGEDVS